jgi:hypothetical protein
MEIIKMSFREVGWGDVNWIGLAQDRDQWMALVSTTMNCRVSHTVDVAHKLGKSRTVSEYEDHHLKKEPVLYSEV